MGANTAGRTGRAAAPRHDEGVFSAATCRRGTTGTDDWPSGVAEGYEGVVGTVSACEWPAKAGAETGYAWVCSILAGPGSADA